MSLPRDAVRYFLRRFVGQAFEIVDAAVASLRAASAGDEEFRHGR